MKQKYTSCEIILHDYIYHKTKLQRSFILNMKSIYTIIFTIKPKYNNHTEHETKLYAFFYYAYK